ncbi:MAG: ABC transporter permease subunit, partial [Bdellovibrio sp.]
MKTWAIFKKEWKSFLLNPTFLLVCAIVTTLLSLKYLEGLASFNERLTQASFMPSGNNKAFNIHYGVFLGHLSILNLILIFVVPAFTMRLLAEEKKMKTYDLLLTAPITSTQIVLGTFLAAIFAVSFLMLLALAYPLATRFFAEFHWPLLLIASPGFLLVALVYVAVD